MVRAYAGAGKVVPAVCRGPALIREGEPVAIARHLKGTGKSVLTFVGYSGPGYEVGGGFIAHGSGGVWGCWRCWDGA